MKKPFTSIAILVFSLIAALQLLRFSMGWVVTVSGVTIPLWASAVAFAVTAGLAVMLWLEARNDPPA